MNIPEVDSVIREAWRAGATFDRTLPPPSKYPAVVFLPTAAALPTDKQIIERGNGKITKIQLFMDFSFKPRIRVKFREPLSLVEAQELLARTIGSGNIYV